MWLADRNNAREMYSRKCDRTSYYYINTSERPPAEDLLYVELCVIPLLFVLARPVYPELRYLHLCSQHIFQAYQDLYTNTSGMLDDFLRFWTFSARYFSDLPILGYEVN